MEAEPVKARLALDSSRALRSVAGAVIWGAEAAWNETNRGGFCLTFDAAGMGLHSVARDRLNAKFRLSRAAGYDGLELVVKASYEEPATGSPTLQGRLDCTYI